MKQKVPVFVCKPIVNNILSEIRRKPALRNIVCKMGEAYDQTELQIRRSNYDNSEIIFLISQ